MVLLAMPAAAFATAPDITRGDLPPDAHYTAVQCTNPDCHAAPTVGAVVPDSHYDSVCVDCHTVNAIDTPPPATADQGPFTLNGRISDISFRNNRGRGWGGGWGQDWNEESDDQPDSGASTVHARAVAGRCEGNGPPGVRVWLSVEASPEAHDIFIYDESQAVETTVFSYNGAPIDRAKFYQLVAGNNYYNDFAAAIGAQPVLFDAAVVYYTRDLSAPSWAPSRCEGDEGEGSNNGAGDGTGDTPPPVYEYAASVALSDAAPLPQVFSGTLTSYKVNSRAVSANAVVKNRRGKVLTFTTHKTKTAYRVNGKKVGRTAFVKALKKARVRTASVTWSSYKSHGRAKRWASQLSLKTRR
jgi:hypothetical protein